MHEIPKRKSVSTSSETNLKLPEIEMQVNDEAQDATVNVGKTTFSTRLVHEQLAQHRAEVAKQYRGKLRRLQQQIDHLVQRKHFVEHGEEQMPTAKKQPITGPELKTSMLTAIDRSLDDTGKQCEIIQALHEAATCSLTDLQIGAFLSHVEAMLSRMQFNRRIPREYESFDVCRQQLLPLVLQHLFNFYPHLLSPSSNTLEPTLVEKTALNHLGIHWLTVWWPAS
jgi:hypothetical protein